MQKHSRSSKGNRVRDGIGDWYEYANVERHARVTRKLAKKWVNGLYEFTLNDLRCCVGKEWNKRMWFYERSMGHFRVPPGLCFKTRVGAQPLIWKSFFILMQIKLVFTRKVVHLASFSKWGFLELGSGLFRHCKESERLPACERGRESYKKRMGPKKRVLIS